MVSRIASESEGYPSVRRANCINSINSVSVVWDSAQSAKQTRDTQRNNHGHVTALGCVTLWAGQKARL